MKHFFFFNHSVWSLLIALVFPVLTVLPVIEATAQRQDHDTDDWRLVMDNDGNEAMLMSELTREDFLAQRMGPLADAGVACIFYCTNACFGLSTRATEVWQMRDYRKSGRPQAFSTKQLVEAGIDPMQTTVEFARQHGIEVYNSIRMNDIHDFNWRTDYGRPMFEHNQLKQSHPDWLLGKPQQRSSTGAWSAVNYALPEVRDSMFAYICESIDNYDLDGVSLDFFRHPVFHQATFAGKPVPAERLNDMSLLIERVRKHIDQVNLQRERKVRLAIRVPDSVEYCRAIGLDVERWLAEGWVDVMTVSGYFRLNDWEASARLGKKYDVIVLASLDESRVRDPAAKAARRSPAAYLGRAAEAKAAGLNGVVTFNLFNPQSPVFRQLANPGDWSNFDKQFFGSIRGMTRANGGNLPIKPYLKTETLNPDRSRPLSVDQSVTVTLRAYPLAVAESSRQLRLMMEPAVAAADVQVLVNRQTVDVMTDGEWLVANSPKLNQARLEIEVKLIKPVKNARLLDCTVLETVSKH